MIRTVAHFPSIDSLSANPYWLILRRALQGQGVRCLGSSKVFGRRWLVRNRHGVQVLHFHYVQQFYAYRGTNARLRWVLRFASNLAMARLLGYRTVFTLHNATPTYPLKPAWVDYLGHRAAITLANRVIVHCDAAAALVRRQFGRRTGIHVVPHPHYIGVYPNTLSQEQAKTRLGLGPGQMLFLFFGGIRPNKGVHALIKAFRRLSGDHLRLIAAGKPWRPPEYIDGLKAMAAQDDRVRLLLGFVPDSQVQVYLNAADVIILPFSRILTSGSVIMAMSFARPVVAPAIGCLPELVTQENGVLYDARVDGALLQALRSCAEGKLDLHALGQRAFETVGQRGWQDLATRTLQAYRGGAK